MLHPVFGYRRDPGDPALAQTIGTVLRDGAVQLAYQRAKLAKELEALGMPQDAAFRVDPTREARRQDATVDDFFGEYGAARTETPAQEWRQTFGTVSLLWQRLDRIAEKCPPEQDDLHTRVTNLARACVPARTTSTR